jgi:hypothetical protein
MEASVTDRHPREPKLAPAKLREAERARAHAAELVEAARAHLAALADPMVREWAAYCAIEDLRDQGMPGFVDVRDQSLLRLHAELGTWKAVGTEVGISREMAWRPPGGRAARRPQRTADRSAARTRKRAAARQRQAERITEAAEQAAEQAAEVAG